MQTGFPVPAIDVMPLAAWLAGPDRDEGRVRLRGSVRALRPVDRCATDLSFYFGNPKSAGTARPDGDVV